MNRFATLIEYAMRDREMTPEQLTQVTGISLSLLNGPFLVEDKCSLTDTEKELLADALRLDRKAVLNVPDTYDLENVSIYQGRGKRRNVVITDDFKKMVLISMDFAFADLDHYDDIVGIDYDDDGYFDERV